MGKLVTIAEAAEILECTVGNIYHKIRRHKIPTETRTVEHREVITRQIPTKYVDLDKLQRKGGE